MITRRQILKVGVASIAVTGLGAGYFAATRRPDKALAPWQDTAHDYTDIRLKALSYAVLAPNPHNRQPWLADISEDNIVQLYCDLERRLPETDPYDRQITIGLGCFLGLFEMAANQFGYKLDIDLFPGGEPFPRLNDQAVARIGFVQDKTVKPNPLFHFIKMRRSNKNVYDITAAVPSAALAALTQVSVPHCSITGATDNQTVDALRDLTWRAHEVETYTPGTLQESIDLMRIGKREINANPDGISLSGAVMEALSHVGMLTREQMADPASTAFAQGLDMYRKIMASAMGYVWVTTPDNSRLSQINAGRAWVAINLHAARVGIGIHPLSQALQEYPEMTNLYTELHDTLDVASPARIQMLGRIGYAPKARPTPRWPMENCLTRNV